MVTPMPAGRLITSSWFKASVSKPTLSLPSRILRFVGSKVGIVISSATLTGTGACAYYYCHGSLKFRLPTTDPFWKSLSFSWPLHLTLDSLRKTSCETSNLVPDGTSNSSLESIVIPTAEATIRAARLVATVMRIVVDYEVAKVETLSPFTIQSKEETEMRKLERTVEQYERELEIAQKTYASASSSLQPPSADSGERDEETKEQRRKRKQQEKTEMQHAAERLAAAQEELHSKEGLSSKSRLHRKQAERLLRLCRQNGGVYIKVGQHLANLDYILPSEYIEVMSSLFDEAPESTYDDVRTVIEEDLGRPVDALFDDFDPVPIASASLAQVHVAYHKETKKKLAIKVQHRGLRETSKGDIYAVTTIVNWIDKYFEDFTFGWIADEIAPQLPLELDFRREGNNAERARENLKGSGLACCIPNVLWESTSPRVLTMDFEEGFNATDKAALEKSGLKKSDVATLVSSVFNSQVFDSGFVHVDPHPANVLLREKNGKPEMVLVDHGLYKEIDTEVQLKYAQLWRSLMLADLDGIEKSCASLGVRAYPLFAAMLTARPYDETIERSKYSKSTWSFSAQRNTSSTPDNQADRAVIAGYAKMFLADILGLLGDLPRDILLLLKMNDCLRHIDFALGSPTNTLVVAGKYASKVVFNHQMSEDGKSLKYKLKCWMEYLRILLRIQLHNFAARIHLL